MRWDDREPRVAGRDGEPCLTESHRPQYVPVDFDGNGLIFACPVCQSEGEQPSAVKFLCLVQGDDDR